MIDSEGNFQDEDVFIAVKIDDLIAVMLLISNILNNDFKTGENLV